MYCSQNFVESDSVFHSQSKFHQQVTCVNPANCRAQNFIFSDGCYDFDFSVIHAVGDGPVQIVNSVSRYFVRNILCFCFIFAETNPCQFRISLGAPGNYGIIHSKFFKWCKQCVDGGIPCLVSGHVGELIWSCNIATSVNIPDTGTQILIDFDCFIFREPLKIGF